MYRLLFALCGIVAALCFELAATTFAAPAATSTPAKLSSSPALATGTAVPAATAVPIPAVAPMDPPELRGLWVDAFHEGVKTPGQIDQMLDWARSAHFNALFVQVRRRGDSYCLKSTEPRTEDPDLLPGFDALQYLIDHAHQGSQPLQVHAWLATLPIWQSDSPPIDPSHVFNQHGPDSADNWLSMRDDGLARAPVGTQGMYYLDPGNPAAAAYTASVYLNLEKNYDVDGIHLDQVRYFEGSPGRWGYNPISVARFNQQYGRDPASQPDAADPDWSAWRRDQVSALVRRIYLQSKALKPKVAVTAAVVAWGEGPVGPDGWNRTSPYSAVFQDWRSWLQEGILDYAIPMDYYRENAQQAGWLDNWSAWQQANHGKRAVAIGLGSYLNSSDENLAQAQRVRALNPLGLVLYSYAVPDVNAEKSQAAALPWIQTLFAQIAPVPDLPEMTGATGGNLSVLLPPGTDSAVVTVRGATSYTWKTDGAGFTGGVDLPPGQYRVIVPAAGTDPAGVSVTIEAGKTTVLALPVPAAGA